MSTPENTTRRKPSFARVDAALDRWQQSLGAQAGQWGRTLRHSAAGRWWSAAARPGIVDWGLLIAVLSIAGVSFIYGDVMVTFQHSFNFLDTLLEGRPQDFYARAIENSAYGHPAVYDIPVYIVFALWNLPTYVIHQLTGFDYLVSTPAQLWLKAMMVVFALIATKLLMTIARALGVSADRSKWVGFYFLSSMSLFVPVFVIVQYDIISIVLMLAGILAYLRGRTRSFLLWFVAANTFKLFALFIFIPLVLLREKNLIRAAAQVLVGLVGLILCRLLYRGDVAFEASTGGFTDLMLNRLVEASIRWQSTVPIPLFVVFMIGLAIFAYAKRPMSERELHAFAIYVSLAAFLAFCALVPLNPYWIALVAPFSVLIIFLNPRHLTLNTLLEVAFSSSVLVIYMLIGFSMYNASMLRDLLVGQFVSPADPQRFGTPGEILVALGLSGVRVYFLVGLMIACSLAVLILNYPRKSFVEGMPNLEPMQRGPVWIRIAAIAGFSALLFAMYFVPARAPLYSMTTSSPQVGERDVLTAPGGVEQRVRLDSAADVERIRVGVDASAIDWIDSSVLVLSVLDGDEEILFEQRSPANAVGAGFAVFETPGLRLEGGEDVIIRLSGGRSEGAPVYAWFAAEGSDGPTFEDGRSVAGDLVLVLDGESSGAGSD